MTVVEKVLPLAEEFTDRILIDNIRRSILLSIQSEYFPVIYNEYKKLRYKLVHATKFPDTGEMTVLFMYDTDK